MYLANAIQNRIDELCNERNLTLNKLCTICGITQSTLNNLKHRQPKSVTVLTIVRICRGLEIEVKDFFDSPLFSDLDDD